MSEEDQNVIKLPKPDELFKTIDPSYRPREWIELSESGLRLLTKMATTLSALMEHAAVGHVTDETIETQLRKEDIKRAISVLISFNQWIEQGRELLDG